jgi:hypothetical protein
VQVSAVLEHRSGAALVSFVGQIWGSGQLRSPYSSEVGSGLRPFSVLLLDPPDGGTGDRFGGCHGVRTRSGRQPWPGARCVSCPVPLL